MGYDDYSDDRWSGGGGGYSDDGYNGGGYSDDDRGSYRDGSDDWRSGGSYDNHGDYDNYDDYYDNNGSGDDWKDDRDDDGSWHDDNDDYRGGSDDGRGDDRRGGGGGRGGRGGRGGQPALKGDKGGQPGQTIHASRFNPDDRVKNGGSADRIATKTWHSYEDRQFDAHHSSVGAVEGLEHGYDWSRPKEIAPNPQLMTDGVHPGDVCQGALGDCWFLGGLSVVAARPDLLHKVIQDDKHAEKGIYSFNFHKFGEWHEVVIDDRIPTMNGSPMFARGKDPNEMWCCLIEKAFAKLHNSYNALDGGWVHEAIADLTGGIPDVIDFEDKGVQSKLQNGSFFKEMLRNHKSGDYLLGCAMSTSGTLEADMGQGILQGHAYGILDVREYRGHQLIRVRNPWGCTEWKGEWSDTDTSKWDDQTRRDLNHELSDDGTFWINFKDFCKQFNRVYTVFLPNTDYDQVGAKGAWSTKLGTAGGCINNPDTCWDNPQYCLEVEEPNTKCHIVLSQPDPRQCNRPVNCAGLSLYKADGKNKTVDEWPPLVKTVITNLRDNELVCMLDRGFYNIQPYTFEPNDEGLFHIEVYATGPVSLTPLDASMDFSNPANKLPVFPPEVSGNASGGEKSAHFKFPSRNARRGKEAVKLLKQDDDGNRWDQLKDQFLSKLKDLDIDYKGAQRNMEKCWGRTKYYCCWPWKSTRRWYYRQKRKRLAKSAVNRASNMV